MVGTPQRLRITRTVGAVAIAGATLLAALLAVVPPASSSPKPQAASPATPLTMSAPRQFANEVDWSAIEASPDPAPLATAAY
ncbi:MAG: hypothetical protein ABI809_03405 [Caldimonas sp.]